MTRQAVWERAVLADQGRGEGHVRQAEDVGIAQGRARRVCGARGAKMEFAFRTGYDGRVSVTHIVERGWSATLRQPPLAAA